MTWLRFLAAALFTCSAFIVPAVLPFAVGALLIGWLGNAGVIQALAGVLGLAQCVGLILFYLWACPRVGDWATDYKPTARSGADA